MSNFAKTWGDEYNKCCKPLQGKGAIRTVESRTVLEGTGPLLKTLVAIDKNDPIALKPGSKERAAMHKALEKELKNFKSEVSKYRKILDAGIKTTDKGDYKDAYRSMKQLRAHLDNVEAMVEHHCFTTSKEAQKAQDKSYERVQKETEAARKKGLSDKEVNEEVDYAKQLRSLGQFSTAVKSAATKAKSAVQAIKADPTPDTYNKAMSEGGRNYTQQISNLVKLSKDSKCPPKVKALLSGIDKYKSSLDAYGNGDRRSIPSTTSDKDVIKYTKEYVQLLKDTGPYAEKMVEFLKKNKLK